ncbi:MAG TPA: DNA polymerase III subunit gamma/tau [Candidatus Omnitrophota bacterium]|nr:DNA polymerase III subunit gamma/tau [Candidatus Omnitrophota bacterium]HPT06933.1 DNA polymerase III subunit gamma/tau [Candidatus Omnitrophota bacterium]
MSYTVFALKWRPNDFDSIIGQNHIVSTLTSAIEKQRLAHAYLFAGPRGVGKTSTARILAKALNCKEGPTSRPCGRCVSCVEITKGSSLDVIEIDGASNRGIDEIRALRENVKFSPVSGKYKIYIIDEVHQITTDGFNALLKTLEEPPEFVKFIFATTHPHKIIPTIVSRCQRLDFRPISATEIVSQLERISTSEKLNVEKDVLFAIAKASEGSLRDAESILDQLVSFSHGDISLKDVVSVLGLVEQDALFALADCMITKNAPQALALLNRVIEEGKDVSVFLTSLIEHFRNLMVAKLTKADEKLIDLPHEICQRLLKQADVLSLDEILSAFNILVNAQEMSKRLDSMRIPLEIALVRLSTDKTQTSHKPAAAVNHRAPQAMPLRSVVQPLQRPVARVEKKSVQPQGKPPVTPQMSAVKLEPQLRQPEADLMPLESIKEAWPRIIEAMTKTKVYLAHYLEEGQPLQVSGNMLTVAFPLNYSLHKESLEGRTNKELVEKTLADVLGVMMRCSFILDDTVKDKQENPEVKSALEMFNGRVIKEE